MAGCITSSMCRRPRTRPGRALGEAAPAQSDRHAGAHRPSGSTLAQGRRPKATGDYKAWTPGNQLIPGFAAFSMLTGPERDDAQPDRARRISCSASPPLGRARRSACSATRPRRRLGAIFGNSPPRPPADVPNAAFPPQPPPVQYPGPAPLPPPSPAPPSSIQASHYRRRQALAAPAAAQPSAIGRTRRPRSAAAPERRRRPLQPANPPPPQPADTSPQPDDTVVTETPAQKIENGARGVFRPRQDHRPHHLVRCGDRRNGAVRRAAGDRAGCYTRPPTEATNTDAFVEVDEVTLQGEVKRIFSGWMFAASPGLHAVEHPIYDVWLTDCASPLKVAEPAAPPAPAPARGRAPIVSAHSRSRRPRASRMPPPPASSAH